jgi:hypothetical protein
MGQPSRLDELRRRVRQDPASIAFAALAEEYRRQGLLGDAIELCRAGLARHPTYILGRVTLARALFDSGDTDAAIVEFEHVLRIAPDNLAALRGLAEAHAERGETRAALDCLRAASVFAPQDPSLRARVEQLEAALGPAGGQDEAAPVAGPTRAEDAGQEEGRGAGPQAECLPGSGDDPRSAAEACWPPPAPLPSDPDASARHGGPAAAPAEPPAVEHAEQAPAEAGSASGHGDEPVTAEAAWPGPPAGSNLDQAAPVGPAPGDADDHLPPAAAWLEPGEATDATAGEASRPGNVPTEAGGASVHGDEPATAGVTWPGPPAGSNSEQAAPVGPAPRDAADRPPPAVAWLEPGEAADATAGEASRPGNVPCEAGSASGHGDEPATAEVAGDRLLPAVGWPDEAPGDAPDDGRSEVDAIELSDLTVASGTWAASVAPEESLPVNGLHPGLAEPSASGAGEGQEVLRSGAGAVVSGQAPTSSAAPSSAGDDVAGAAGEWGAALTFDAATGLASQARPPVTGEPGSGVTSGHGATPAVPDDEAADEGCGSAPDGGGLAHPGGAASAPSAWDLAHLQHHAVAGPWVEPVEPDDLTPGGPTWDLGFADVGLQPGPPTAALLSLDVQASAAPAADVAPQPPAAAGGNGQPPLAAPHADGVPSDRRAAALRTLERWLEALERARSARSCPP